MATTTCSPHAASSSATATTSRSVAPATSPGRTWTATACRCSTAVEPSAAPEGGAGGQDILEDRGRYYMVNHYYEWDPLQIRMQICELQWDDRWPEVPEDETSM